MHEVCALDFFWRCCKCLVNAKKIYILEKVCTRAVCACSIFRKLLFLCFSFTFLSAVLVQKNEKYRLFYIQVCSVCPTSLASVCFSCVLSNVRPFPCIGLVSIAFFKMASGDHRFSGMAEEIAFSVVGRNERFSGLDIQTGYTSIQHGPFGSIFKPC